jgi:hypothetical protein
MFKVTVTPVSAVVKAGQTVQFTASVTGGDNKKVAWTTDQGKVDGTGLYAPPETFAPGFAKVTATSYADNTAFGSASVQLSVIVMDVEAEALAIAEKAAADIANLAKRDHLNPSTVNAVLADIQKNLVDYQAKREAYAKQETAKVAAKEGGEPVSISPASVTVPVGRTQQFFSSKPVKWSATFGSISPDGLFTAPDTTGSSGRVIAVSTANAEDKAYASVSVG